MKRVCPQYLHTHIHTYIHTYIIRMYSSEYALCYNDKSVLENHHLYCAFKILKEVSQYWRTITSTVHSRY